MGKITLFLTAALFFALTITGCTPEKSPEAAGETAVPTTATTAVTEPADESPVAGTIMSQNMFVDDRYVIYVNPSNRLLTRADRAEGETKILYQVPVFEEFFEIGDRIYFRELSSNLICSINKDGADFESYLKMPFTTGVMIDGTMYFINAQDYTNETVLYRYDIESGEWSAGTLSGNRQSPVRKTVAFTENGIYYISHSGGNTSIMEYIYLTGEKITVYTASANYSGEIPEILYINGALIFRDPEEEGGFLSIGADNAVARYNLEGIRVFGALEDGLLYCGEKSGVLLKGDAEGHVSEYTGGSVLACATSRALVFRSSGMEDRVALIKYPDDTEQYRIKGTPYKVLTCKGYAFVFLYDSGKAYFIDMEKPELTEYPVTAFSLTEVGIDLYIKENSYSGTTPSDVELKTASPATLAKVFAEAVTKNDRLTLNKLLPAGEWLKPYLPVVFKDWKVTLADGENMVYTIEYTPYNDEDLAFEDLWPDIIRRQTLTLVEKNGVWQIVEG